MSETKPKILGLALVSLFFAILMPPEAYPTGKMVVVLSSTFALLALIQDRKVPRSYLLCGIAVFALLLIHSLWLSVDAYRSIEFLTILWAYYCLLGFFVYAGRGSINYVAAAVVALSLIVSGYGIYQFFWGFDQISAQLLGSPAAQSIKDPALAVLSTGRVFSTLALPGTLWGFLLTALPVHFVLWNRSRALNVILGLSVALLLVTGLMTRSFGFLAGLLVLAIAWLLIRGRQGAWKKVSAVVGICAIAGGAFYFARVTAFGDGNPAELRFKNWVSAWNVFAVSPAGTGLNTFGVVYSQYHLPGANETQYAHNTPLQLMAELGYGALLAAAIAILALAGRKRGEALQQPMSYILMGVTAWVFHHVIDINFYFPSVGSFGVILVGLLLSRPETEVAKPSRQLSAALSLVALAAVFFSGIVFGSSELEHRAQIEIENGMPDAALETLRLAQKVTPWNAVLFERAGNILLESYVRTKDQSLLEAAENSLRKATELSPLKSDAHLGLALCLSASNKLDAALAEIRIASRLYPDSAYVRSVAKLMEQRVQ